jgi:hypothetical protein
MWLLLNWRVWAAVTLAVFLAGTHWKAYTAGKRTIQTQFTAYIAEEKVLQSAATETARLRERSITDTLRTSYDAYNVLKNSRIADSKLASSSLQQLEATAASHPGGNTTTSSGVDVPSPYRELFLSCSRTIQTMAEEADGISVRLLGLQNYVSAIREKSIK